MMDKSNIKTLSKYLAILSASVILIVSILMIMNYLQIII